MKKKMLTVFLCLAMLVSVVAPVSAGAATRRDLSEAETWAQGLKQLGLFKGVSETDFALGRAPTRIEALVMLIRSLGKENDALHGEWSHPFQDVPEWADKYVGYAYQNGLAKGVSETLFGTGNATAQMYITFALRALGYSDTNNLDFSYENPYTLAHLVDLIPEQVDMDNFLRADVVYITVYALWTELKGSDYLLANKLIVDGTFSQDDYDAFMTIFDDGTESSSSQGGSVDTNQGNAYYIVELMKSMAKQYGFYSSEYSEYQYQYYSSTNGNTQFEYYINYIPSSNAAYLELICRSNTSRGKVVSIVDICPDNSVGISYSDGGQITNINAWVNPSEVIFESEKSIAGFSATSISGYTETNRVVLTTELLQLGVKESLVKFDEMILSNTPYSIRDLGYTNYYY